MSHLVVPKAVCVESRENFARFVAEPLEKGFGVTLGNTMRRVLLGHLQGAAVTRVKIEGIQHEFSTIPHAKEDATDFILNLKALRVKALSGEAGKLLLEVEGESRVSAADIRPSADFEVINPELYLIALDSPEAKLYVELDVEMGKGYRDAESTDNLPIGVIPVDTIFSPIRKVNFTVAPISVGEEVARERLFLDVWTDGSISPGDAISQAAGILTEQLFSFAHYSELSVLGPEAESSFPPMSDELFNMPVEQLTLSVRTMNCLRRGGIATVGELASKREKDLKGLRNFGQKSNLEIQDRLGTLGLSLASYADEDEEPEEAVI
ncbi:MAG: DNA-directed RNA polymerase subunit alpha [Dehalococcoidales bacterium]|nr:DNA-directed RNA polymerase subunit alpha [Dehalococcoidales bacterium]